MSGEPDLKVIEEKMDKGEELTAEEEKAVLGVEDPEEPEEESADPDEVEDQKTGKEAQADDKKEAETEEPLPTKDADDAEAKEKEAKAAEARRKEIEADADKSADEVDLSEYSPNERALYFDLKKERRKRQDAQREADTLRFESLKREQREKEERERREREEAAKPAADPFDGLDDGEFLTVAEMRKILQKSGPSKESKTEKPAMDNTVREQNERLLLQNWTLQAKLKYPDAEEIINLADEVLAGDKIAEAEVADVIRKGGNAAIATYNLIKAHPKYAEIESKNKAGKDAQKSKEEEARINKERAERIEANKKKAVTTGSGGGAASTGEYTLADIDAMSEQEFAALPKAKRDKILEMIG